MKRGQLVQSAWLLAAATLHASEAVKLSAFARTQQGVATASRGFAVQQPAAMSPDVEVDGSTDAAPSGETVYRPFATRFDTKDANKSSPSFTKPENRQGYRNYAFEHPRHGLSPNSNDRNAESTALLVIVVAAFSLVFCAIIAIDRLQYLPPEKQLPGILAAGAVPWLIATGWISQVAVRHLGHPMRDGMTLLADDDGMEWMCDALVYYLLLLPFVTAAAAISQALSMRQAAIPEESGKHAPMGRMFDSTFTHDDYSARKFMIRFTWFIQQPSVRYTFLVLDGFLLTFGVLVVFFGGRGCEFCQPEVWWTSVVLAASTVMAVVLVVFSALGCLAVMHIARSPWLQDFVSSFQRQPHHLVDCGPGDKEAGQQSGAGVQQFGAGGPAAMSISTR